MATNSIQVLTMCLSPWCQQWHWPWCLLGRSGITWHGPYWSWFPRHCQWQWKLDVHHCGFFSCSLGYFQVAGEFSCCYMSMMYLFISCLRWEAAILKLFRYTWKKNGNVKIWCCILCNICLVVFNLRLTKGVSSNTATTCISSQILLTARNNLSSFFFFSYDWGNVKQIFKKSNLHSIVVLQYCLFTLCFQSVALCHTLSSQNKSKLRLNNYYKNQKGC